MFYSGHQIRDYCLYLGSLETGNKKLDMGVYEQPDGRVSHAIVYGPEDSEYISGGINLDDEKDNFSSFYCQINIILYREFLQRG